MAIIEVVTQVRELLQQQGRLSYRILKRQFSLDDDALEDLKFELIDIQEVAVDKDGKMLVWAGRKAGEQETGSKERPTAAAPEPRIALPASLSAAGAEAERRQLTVMFCDLVGSTALSEQLDPEELREVIRLYQETCTAVIQRYAGHIAQHLGDGLLVYFGYPVAHEDDAQRAVRAGLEIVAALQPLSTRHEVPSPLVGEPVLSLVEGGQGEGAAGRARTLTFPHPNLPLQEGKELRRLQVRIGIHTGLVVIGEIGSSEKREILALGETPNIAARLQALAEPDTLVISAATQRLVQGLFECQDLGPQTLKGLSTLLTMYCVVREGTAQSRFEAAVQRGLTPLVGRAEELALLQRRWAQAKAGAGQVVLLSGEPGIGKSRLVQELKDQIGHEGAMRIEFRCSPYHQNSALYPLIDHLQRLLQFAREDSPTVKLEKLQHTLSSYRFPQADTFPLLAMLLSLPYPEGYPPIRVSPQKQKEKIHAALVAWLVEEAEQRPICTTWEDVHWADPSTLQVLTLVVDQVPTTRLYVLLTFRPEFTPPWGNRSHLSQLTLSRLGRSQVETMVEQVTGGKALPAEVVQQIVAKTDGVPLFVEELTKTVVESGLLTTMDDHYELSGPLSPLAIPSTLHASLLARLDRLSTVREIAQLGATIGREFSYELLHAVSPLDEGTLQHGLKQLVEAELVYQRGLGPQAHYLFKHALIQDTAYQSLLKSTRQQYHQQIAQVLEERFPETTATQPELLAHHYTEAGLSAQAIPYWQQAGQKAVEHSAHVEAISHLTTALELLKTLPDAPERTRHELTLQIALGGPLMATKGQGAPEVGAVYTRARELCRQLEETSQLFPVLFGLRLFYLQRELQTARKVGEQLLELAQSVQNPALLLEAHYALGVPLSSLGELVPARAHFEQVMSLYDPLQHSALAFRYGIDLGVACLSHVAWILWYLGYPARALRSIHDALALAGELSSPYSLGFALNFAAVLHQLRREGQATQERAEAAITLSSEQGFVQLLALGTALRGWALVERGQREEGIAQIRQGIAGDRATRIESVRPTFFVLLAEAYGKVGQAEGGLALLAEALDAVGRTGERFYEAELYRLKGELLLAQEGLRLQAVGYRAKTEEAEECFLQAIEIARKQQAKSLELRAVMSLSRLWQQQGKATEARPMLAEIYGWFTKGFDTKDLQEAKALLQELAEP